MAKARREMEGEAVAHLIRCIPVAILDPEKLRGVQLNPFREPPVESARLREHKAKIAAMRFKAMTGGV